MKKITLLALSIWFLGASCEKSDNVEKLTFSQSNEISNSESDYQNIKKQIYNDLESNWSKNLDENEKYFIEALNTNEDFIRTKTINEDKLITVDIKFKFDYSDEAISLLSGLYSAIYNAPVYELKNIFNNQKNILVKNEKLTQKDFDVLYPIYASLEANIEFIEKEYQNLTNKSERSSIIKTPLFQQRQGGQSWLDCMAGEGKNISRGLVDGAISGAIGGAISGAAGGTVVIPGVGTATGAVGGGVFGGAIGAGTGMLNAFIWSSVDCFTKTQGGGGSQSSGGCAITVPIDPKDPRFKGINRMIVIKSKSMSFKQNNIQSSLEDEYFEAINKNLPQLMETSHNSVVTIKLNNK
ncbi:hypothetical protein [Myroides odoratus]|uniref:hypothetical protein n=1 Tax=Myroides odoratus TaxID=256 RepID=UPI00333F2266